MYYQNIRGCRSKLHDLSLSIISCNLDIIALSETWLHADIHNSELVNSNYTLYRKDRNFERTNVSKGGGVLIAVSSEYTSSQLNFDSLLNAFFNVDIVGVSVDIANIRFYIIVIYIPPNFPATSYELIFDSFCSLTYLNNSKSNLIVVGDFNLTDYVKYYNDLDGTCPPSIMHLRNFMSFFGISQLNSVRNSNERILDLVMCQQTISVSESLDPLLPVDAHHPPLDIHLDIPVLLNKPKHNCNRSYNFKKADFSLLYSEILAVDWSFLDSVCDVNEACDLFYVKLENIFSKCVPIKKRTNSKYPVWFTRAIIRNMKKKIVYHRKFKATGNTDFYIKFKSLRSQLKKDIAEARHNFTNEAENNLLNNPSQFWSYINSFNNTSNLPSSMKLGDHLLCTPQEIVNGFASFFQSLYIQSSTIDLSNFVSPVNVPALSISSFSNEIVLKFLKKFKSNLTSGPDCIPSFLLKDCAIIFVEPLTKIFNLILKTSSFPSIWKISKIYPVFKSGDRNNIAQYRPIVLSSNFSKLFEMVLNDYLSAHTKPYISPYQHGFRGGRSTVSNLMSVSQFIASILDTSGQVDVIYTDFAKAFDRLDHGLLIKKLASFGFNHNLLVLLKSYLLNRRLTVQYCGFKSLELSASSGVPQGSILGPLFFVLFINDIGHNVKNNFLLYADDCKLFGRIDSPQDCQSLQMDLNTIQSWCTLNALPLNISKCKFVRFSRKRQTVEFEYQVDNVPLENCNSFKDLGVIFDSRFSFSNHVSVTITAAFKKLGFLIRNTQLFSNIRTMKLLYNVFVRTKLEYASVVWGQGYNYIETGIERVQRRFLKHLCLKVDGIYPERGVPHNELLMRFEFNLLGDRRTFASIVFLYKLLNNFLDSSDLLAQVNIHVPGVNTRNNKTFYLPVPHTNLLIFSPLYNMCNKYNQIQDSIDIFCCSVSDIRRTVLNRN